VYEEGHLSLEPKKKRTFQSRNKKQENKKGSFYHVWCITENMVLGTEKWNAVRKKGEV